MRIFISTLFFVAAVMVGFAAYYESRRARFGEGSLEDGLILFAIMIGLVILGVVVKPRRKRARETYFDTKDDQVRDQEFEAMTGQTSRPDAVPGWSMSLRSPFSETPASSSWFGGLPVMPPETEWPWDFDGKRMHFLCQIDLSALSEPKPAALYDRGALLLFVSFKRGGGQKTYSALQLSEDALRRADQRPAPEDLGPLADAGFFKGGQTFPHWLVDLHYRMDNGEEIAPTEPSAEAWITNWGTALLEAKGVQAELAMGENRRTQFERWMATRDADAPPLKPFQETTARHHATMRQLAPAFNTALDGFIAKAERQRPDAPVDPNALADILQLRRDLAAHPATYQLEGVLVPNRQSFINRQIGLKHEEGAWRVKADGPASSVPLEEVPSYLRHVVSGFIENTWFHGLFGGTLPQSSEPIELCGFDCLAMFPAHKLLGTVTDHELGFSIWCPTEDMALGDLFSGKLVWHTNA